ncbi:MAG: hypothetical protein DYG83_03035 [Candidatus Brocadia sp. AMX2]|nr:hypothetical protein [Candidatus Brocadia sp.]MBL1167475.1 hypothetical protein [Candidatus Brocadia sp. AMX1]MCE7865801.1 hypothetical protein [Candidatus Brocadia sp. AMX2]MCQ3916171.1 hypothetical protein [Candidatus Brocadia sp.]RIJ92880.1 MAG: hypothetical protein DB853_03045 [Candidatus Brocadia sp.]
MKRVVNLIFRILILLGGMDKLCLSVFYLFEWGLQYLRSIYSDEKNRFFTKSTEEFACKRVLRNRGYLYRKF